MMWFLTWTVVVGETPLESAGLNSVSQTPKWRSDRTFAARSARPAGPPCSLGETLQFQHKRPWIQAYWTRHVADQHYARLRELPVDDESEPASVGCQRNRDALRIAPANAKDVTDCGIEGRDLTKMVKRRHEVNEDSLEITDVTFTASCTHGKMHNNLAARVWPFPPVDF